MSYEPKPGQGPPDGDPAARAVTRISIWPSRGCFEFPANGLSFHCAVVMAGNLSYTRTGLR
jgi:hypothetical protein